jgi:DNA processing protein
MYDPKVNVENPKYDLNRQLIREDDRIIVISNDNFQEALKKILSRHAKPNRDIAIQTSLF